MKITRLRYFLEKNSKFNKKNYKIIFVGNIKYTPNKNACFEFATKILPKINKIYPEIEFHIIGEISKIDKFLLLSKNNVKIFGKKNIQGGQGRRQR